MYITDFVKKSYNDVLFVRHDPDGTISYFSHLDFPGLTATPYSFDNGKGNTLFGNLYSYPGADGDRLIVFDHGMGTGHRAYMREIEMLAKHGYTVLAYDHTGCGLSEGENIGGFAGSLSDLDACIKSIKASAEYSDRKLSVIGHSWGAFSTMNILAFHPDIECIVAISGFVSVRGMQKQIIPAIFGKARRALYLLESENSPRYVNSTACETLKNTNARVLLIHSKDDKTVSYRKHLVRLQKSLRDKENIRFLTVNGKNHNPNYTKAAVIYKDAFMKAHDMEMKAGGLNSDEEKKVFLSRFDFYRMTEQDESVWAEIFRTLDNK